MPGEQFKNKGEFSMKKKAFLILLILFIIFTCVSFVGSFANDSTGSEKSNNLEFRLLIPILDCAIFGILGVVLLIIGYYIWELITPYSVKLQLIEQKNMAVGIVVAAFIIGTSIIVAASILKFS